MGLFDDVLAPKKKRDGLFADVLKDSGSTAGREILAQADAIGLGKRPVLGSSVPVIRTPEQFAPPEETAIERDRRRARGMAGSVFAEDVPTRTLGELASDTYDRGRIGVRGVAGGLVELANTPQHVINLVNSSANGYAQMLGAQARIPMLPSYDWVRGTQAGLDEESKAIREKMTPTAIRQGAEFESVDGVIPTLGYLATNPGEATGQLAEQAPQFLAAGLPGGVPVKLAGAGAFAGGQTGAQVGAENQARVKRGEITQAQADALTAQGVAGSAIVNSILPKIIPGGTVLEDALAGNKTGLTRGRGAALGLLGEGLTGGIEEAADQALQNETTGRPVGEGVGKAFALGALLEGPVGAGAGFLSSGKPRTLGEIPPEELGAAARAAAPPVDAPQTSAIDPAILAAGNEALASAAKNAPPAPVPRDPAVAPEPTDDIDALLARNLPPDELPPAAPASASPSSEDAGAAATPEIDWQAAAEALGLTEQPAQAQDGFPSEGAGGSQPTPVQSPTVEAPSGQANPVEGGGLAGAGPAAAGAAEQASAAAGGDQAIPVAPDGFAPPPPTRYSAADMRQLVGWSQRGGEMVRAPVDDRLLNEEQRTGGVAQPKGEVIGRTRWTGWDGPDGQESTFWKNRPKGITEAQANAAFDKLERGEALTAKEQRFIDYADAVAGEYDAAMNLLDDELRGYSEIERQRGIDELRRQHDIAVQEADQAEALSVYELAHRAASAGVDPFDIAQSANEPQPAYAARLWNLIQEAGRGTDNRAAEQDRAGSNRGRESRAQGAAEGFALTQQRAPAEQAAAPEEVGLFAPPTAQERNRAAQQQKDASRNGLGRDVVRPEQGDGELLAGGRPAQARVDEANESRQRGEDEADLLELRDAVEAAVGPGRVEYLHDPSGLPDRLRKGVESRMQKRGGKGKTAALYDPVTKKVYLFTGTVTTPSRAVWHVLHEIAGHHGLREFLGDKLAPALEIALQNATVKRVAEAIAKERNIDMASQSGRLLAAEEALAELAAAVRTGNFDAIASRYKVEVPDGMRASVAKAVENFVKRLKKLLDDMFGRPMFMDEDVRGLLEAAWQAAQGNQASMTIMGADGALEQVVFHGTPHTVDRFSLQKIGTGEGAQAYGWGLYFASQKAIAEHYRRALSDRFNPSTPAQMLWNHDGTYSVWEHKPGDAMISLAREGLSRDEAAALVDEINAREKLTGNLYRVEVPEDSDLLDWDKPLSEQPEKVKAAIESLGEVKNRSGQNILERDPTGEEVYRALGEAQTASETLMSLGIPGLRYLDGNSRSKGEGSANYVIWDEAAIGQPESALESTEDQAQSEAFRKWFGDSVVTENGKAGGKPLVVYHGSDAKFDAFEVGRKGFRAVMFDDREVESQGMFFSESKEDAAGYGRNVIAAYLSLQNPFMHPSDVPASSADPASLERAKRAWDDAEYILSPLIYESEVDGSRRVDYNNGLSAVKVDDDAEWMEKLFVDGMIDWDVLDNADVVARMKERGYDGVKTYERNDESGSSWFVVSPNQIKSATGNNGNFDPSNPSILESVESTEPRVRRKRGEPMSAAERDANFRRWSNNAPLVTRDEAMDYGFKTGEKVVVEAIHGTKRPDRIGKGFNAKRATSGPMPYFTSDAVTGSSYATGKNDTSLSYEDQDFGTWFKVKVPGSRNPVSLDRAWHFLPSEVRSRIASLAPRISTDYDTGENIELRPEGHANGIGNYDWEIKQARGNALKALIEGWLSSGTLFNDEQRFMEVLEMAGMPMDTVTFDSPFAEYPALFPVYVRMRKPLVTNDIPQDVVDALNAAAKRDRSRAASGGADAWDKSTRTLREWVAAFNEDSGDAAYVWTSIPDKVTDVFRSLGYDGIVDMGGKGGGANHRVYIPFSEGQVKGKFNKGKFDDSKRDLLESVEYTPEQEAALTKAGLQVDRRTSLQRTTDALREKWRSAKEVLTDPEAMKQAAFDRFHGLRHAEAQLGLNDPETSAYIAARMSAGLDAAMEAMLSFGAPVWDGGVLGIKDGTVGLLDALKPVEGMVDEWLGWMVGRRAKLLKSQGRENNLTDDDIAALLSLADGREQAFQQAARDYLKIKNAVLDVAEQAGLVDPSARAVWDHAEYIPFYRAEGDGSSGPGTRKGLQGQTSGIRTLKGGDQALADPLANIIRNFTKLVDASMKNRAVLLAVDNYGNQVFEKVGMDMAQALVPLDQVKKHLREQGTPESVINALPAGTLKGVQRMLSIVPPSAEDVVRVMRDGKAEYYRVKDPLVLRALTAFKQPNKNIAIKPFIWFKRLLTTGVTVTPEFIAANFIRDSGSAWVISDDRFKPGWDSMRGVVNTLRNDQTSREMMMAGSTFLGGQFYDGNPDKAANAIRRALRSKGMSNRDIEGFIGTIASTPLKLWDGYLKLSGAVENANRRAVFDAAIKAGRTRTEAAYMARDLMDFAMQGDAAWVQLFSDILPFFNARLQGLYKLGRRAGTKQGKRAILLRGGVITLATVALYAWNLLAHSDGWDELEEWDKDAYWHVAPGTPYHIRIPKPFELGLLFGTAPERGMDAIRNRINQAEGDKPETTLDALIRAITGTLAFNPVPQAALPIAEQWANKRFFTGRPIENMGDEKLLPEDRREWYTSDTMRALGRMSGISPKRLEHIWNGYTAGMGGYMLDASDVAVRMLEGAPDRPSMNLSDMPLAGRFARGGSPGRTKYGEQFYERLRKGDQIEQSIKSRLEAGDEAGALKLERENAGLLGERIPSKRAKEGFLYSKPRAMRKVRGELSAIRDEIEAIATSRNVSAEEKRQQINALEERRNKVFRDAVKSAEQ